MEEGNTAMAGDAAIVQDAPNLPSAGPFLRFPLFFLQQMRNLSHPDPPLTLSIPCSQSSFILYPAYLLYRI